MSKRKGVVNDIIYELDIEDLDSSSEDEKQMAKKSRTDADNVGSAIVINDSINENVTQEIFDVDSSDDALTLIVSPVITQNGGKSPSLERESCINTKENVDESNKDSTEVKIISNEPDIAGTTIIDSEDIKIDSPGSNSVSNIVVGCENRSPIVTVKFKNKKIAKDYKRKIKEFMLKLIKLHDEESLTGSENETDLELDIWPEDLSNAADVIAENEEYGVDDSLFFVDTAPQFDDHVEAPQYSQASSILANEDHKETSPPPVRRGPICFNCEGAHQLRDCTLPRNNKKIMESRKAMNATRVGRYHIEDDQKYGHLVAGRISGQLRHALGLRRDELPLHIYRMRVLGYPPGWLEEARICHSGITMFDSSGKATLEPEEEEGEVCEPGSKDKFDIRKVLDFPGFNMPSSSRYKEEAHRYGLPPLSELDSKLNMLQVLAPNAMKAYKRKKLTFFPSASPNATVREGQAEMDLDDSDEVAEFPSVPPLPDEAPPPPPPPPECPPPPPNCPPLPPDCPPLPPDCPPLPPECPPTPPDEAPLPLDPPPGARLDNSIDVEDIPMPADDIVTAIDEKLGSSNGRDSPSLDDLEEKKRLLLAALESGTSVPSSPSVPKSEPNNDKLSDDCVIGTDTVTPISKSKEIETATPTSKVSGKVDNDSDTPETPKTAGHVKTTSYGTPVLNIASSFSKLPTDDKFAKDICDVINFENLPDSTGKYQKICHLLKRVKSEVDRIQES